MSIRHAAITMHKMGPTPDEDSQWLLWEEEELFSETSPLVECLRLRGQSMCLQATLVGLRRIHTHSDNYNNNYRRGHELEKSIGKNRDGVGRMKGRNDVKVRAQE